VCLQLQTKEETMRFTAALAVMMLIAALAGGSAQAQTKWDMPVGYAETSFKTINDRAFADDVKRLSGGKLLITVHPNQVLFKMPEIKRAVQTGQVPIAEFFLSAYGNEDPMYEVDAIPFLIEGYEGAWKLYQAQKPFLNARFSRQGLRLLYSDPFPAQNFYTVQPLTDPAQFKGLKFRAQNPVVSRLAELLGAVPVTIQQPEVPQAFLSGVVNIMMTSTALGVETSAWEYSKYYYVTNAMYVKTAVITNERAFKALPANVREAVLKAAKDAEKRGWEMCKKNEREGEKILASKGIVVGKASPAVMQALRKASEPLVKDWLKKAGSDGAALVKALR
jgi:TRAP-type C4-dicarboxylate transport system substrate-binding protein